MHLKILSGKMGVMCLLHWIFNQGTTTLHTFEVYNVQPPIINSLRPNHGIYASANRSSLVQIIDSLLPVPCQTIISPNAGLLEPWKHISLKFKSKWNNWHAKKWIVCKLASILSQPQCVNPCINAVFSLDCSHAIQFIRLCSLNGFRHKVEWSTHLFDNTMLLLLMGQLQG